MVPRLATKDDPMTKLSDTQVIILSAAAQRPNRLAIPLPHRLKGGAAQKVVDAMLARGLLARVPAAPGMPAFGAQAEDGGWTTLVATDAGLDAIGIEPEARPEAAVPYAFNAGTNSAGEPAAGAPTGGDTGGDEAPVEATPKRRSRSRQAAPTGADVAPARKTRDGTKQAQLIAMLRRPEGATIAQIAADLGWAAHTVRGAFAGALKKKLGLTVTSEKVEGGERTYRIADEPVAQEAGR